jgi:hypothetical protein
LHKAFLSSTTPKEKTLRG